MRARLKYTENRSTLVTFSRNVQCPGSRSRQSIFYPKLDNAEAGRREENNGQGCDMEVNSI